MGEALEDCLTTILERALGAGPHRPVDFVRSLGVEKTLASRLFRALQVSDAIERLHLLPAPQGLRLLLERCEKAVGRGEETQALEGAIRAYEVACRRFPGGRRDLEAAFVGWVPALRLRTEHQARREIFRARCSLGGIRSLANHVPSSWDRP